MELRQINNIELNEFVSSQPHSQFLQSASWGEFQKSLSREVWRYGVFDNNKIIASASFISMPLGFKKCYLYCPRGPVIKNDLPSKYSAEALKLILSKTRDLTMETKQAEEIFFRFELTTSIIPLINYPNIQLTKAIQPPDTLILNLTKSSQELLASFHSKTRYNIRVAEKHGVIIEKIGAIHFNECWTLYKQTCERDQFGLHPYSYYQKMLELKELELWVAKSANNDIIAANIMIFYGDTTTYLHGASDYQNRNLMAPHLLQWTLIQEAKLRGFKYYDFHGIAPENAPSHPLAGVTRFKKCFYGHVINYPGTYDFIYESGWYKLYRILRKINHIIK